VCQFLVLKYEGLGILIKKLKLTSLFVMFPKQHNKKPHLWQFNTIQFCLDISSRLIHKYSTVFTHQQQFASSESTYKCIFCRLHLKLELSQDMLLKKSRRPRTQAGMFMDLSSVLITSFSFSKKSMAVSILRSFHLRLFLHIVHIRMLRRIQLMLRPLSWTSWTPWSSDWHPLHWVPVDLHQRWRALDPQWLEHSLWLIWSLILI